MNEKKWGQNTWKKRFLLIFKGKNRQKRQRKGEIDMKSVANLVRKAMESLLKKIEKKIYNARHQTEELDCIETYYRKN